MDQDTLFIDVVLPMALPGPLTYRVPRDAHEAFQSQNLVGRRVVVPLGRKVYTGLLVKVHHAAPTNYTAKYVEGLLDDHRVVPPLQIKLWFWMAEYYMCSVGEVMAAALPSSMKLASETKISYNPDYNRNWDVLNDKEYLIAEALQLQDCLTLQEIAEIVEQKTIQPLVKSLIDKGVALTQEELQHRYIPKNVVYLRLNDAFSDEDVLSAFLNQVEKRAPKQMELMLAYFQIWEERKGKVEKLLVQKRAGVDASVVNKLVAKGVLDLYEEKVDRVENNDDPVELSKPLSEAQERAYTEIKDAWVDKSTVLLHGVTSSGKTEIYVKLIEEVLQQGKQVLYLLPEIALTTQLINRLKKYFGKRVGVYHSKFNQHERVEIWQKVLLGIPGEYDIVLGARSALFLPFQKLGLVIVDEEHETSFKQFDPAPRYQARDMAVVLAGLFKCKLLMGSATPSVETYWNAKEGRYGLVEIEERFGGMMLPEIQCADIRKEKRRKTMRGSFTSFLIEAMEAAFEKGKQIILFQNRRGYSPLWQCQVCGEIPECKRCDVSLTYHKYNHQLKCHYCGYHQPPPGTCASCGSTELEMVGFGTEKIEEEVAELFPGKTIQRMDLETTRSKKGYEQIIEAFESGAVDVLVGTQMVTKGLDFDNVGLVGVMNADQMLKFPDFRSFERSYQLLAQVSGRAGRKGERGKVIVQTYTPDHWVIQKVMQNDYQGLFDQELLERRNFKYPPFYRLIKLIIKHKDPDVVAHAAQDLANVLRNGLSERVLGPEAPYVSRINLQYIRQILIKFERDASTTKLKIFIRDSINTLKTRPEYKSLRVNVDVDPY